MRDLARASPCGYIDAEGDSSYRRGYTAFEVIARFGGSTGHSGEQLRKVASKLFMANYHMVKLIGGHLGKVMKSKREEQLFAVMREDYDLSVLLNDTLYYFRKAKHMTWFEFCDKQDRMHGVGKYGNGESEEEESPCWPTPEPFISSFQVRTRTITP